MGKILKAGLSTENMIDELFDNFKDLLKHKNRKYGDSALNPIAVFSKIGAEHQICNRLDDKISRIKNSNELRKNDVADIFGYIALLLIQNEWTEFEDQKD